MDLRASQFNPQSNYNKAAYNDTVATEATISPVQQAASIISDRRENLSVLISELEKRISPVLRPNAPSSAGQASAESKSMRSGMAEMMFVHGAQLGDLCQRLSEIIDRIEL